MIRTILMTAILAVVASACDSNRSDGGLRDAFRDDNSHLFDSEQHDD
jgi:hypothetical protein